MSDKFADSNILLYLFSESTAKKETALRKNCDVRAISTANIESALQLLKRYKYSFWDSLIIASALEANCSILYSEDMQHKQVIVRKDSLGENKLTIVNPFL